MITIRKDRDGYLRELRLWLSETAETPPEEMREFFTARLSGYEEHMSAWKAAYKRFAELLPEAFENVLDLGVGTGLELDEIFRLRPELRVTGIDLNRNMLSKLSEKHSDKALKILCEDYLLFDLGYKKWDGVISFQSLHHFLPETKEELYEKTRCSLKDGGVFLFADYIACCEEEENLLRKTYFEKRNKFHIPEETFVHLDIPLTAEHETEILRNAGFSQVSVVESIDGTTIISARK